MAQSSRNYPTTGSEENVYFLFTDVQQAGGSHQLVYGLMNAEINAEVFVFVHDFGKLRHLRQEFPLVTFLLLDLNKNTAGVNKGILRLLPEIECYLNFSGKEFSDNLKDITEIFVDREYEYPFNTLNIQEINSQLKDSLESGCVIFNIVTNQLENKPKELNSILKKKRSAQPPPTTQDYMHTVGNFKKPLKFPSSARYRKPQPAPFFATERQPLLLEQRQRERQLRENPCFSLFSLIFCCCYPRCCLEEEVRSEFDNVQHLRRHMRMKHALELKRGLADLFDQSEQDWRKTLTVLAEKEENKMDELTEKVQERKDQKEAELQRKFQEANARTGEALGDVLSERLLQGIAESREKFAKKKSGWGANDAFRQGRETIRKAAEMERMVKKQEHYSKILVRQFNIMQACKDKWDRRLERQIRKFFLDSDEI